jgi:hypothetical protein
MGMGVAMNYRWVLAGALALVASSASAERLEFDHRLYPPLQRVLDGNDKDMLHFDNSKPSRLVDLIAIKGKSAQNWTEAFEIVAVLPPADASTPRAWMDSIRARSDLLCPNTVAVLAEDAVSITFERQSPGCHKERSQTAIYRLFAGKRSWFQLTVMHKTVLDEAARKQWLELLASAKLK